MLVSQKSRVSFIAKMKKTVICKDIVIKISGMGNSTLQRSQNAEILAPGLAQMAMGV